jgi:deoxyribonucleoside regulator
MSWENEPTRREALITVARMYYEQDLSQQEIAGRLGVARSSISAMLKLCREQGIVEIRVNDDSSHVSRLAATLRERFGLADAVVVPAGADSAQAKAHVGMAAARRLRPLLHEGIRIGISWGTTLYELVRHLEPLPLRGSEVVQLHGGLGAGDPAVDGFGLAQKLAEKLAGAYRIVQAPLVVRDVSLRQMLLKEPGVARVLEEAASVELALFGIGSNLPAVSSLVRAGFLRAEDSEALLSAGALGTVCGLHIGADGAVLPCDVNDRLVGIDRATLERIPVRLCVAAGAEKTAVVLAALRGGFVTMLVVDEPIAVSLVGAQAASMATGAAPETTPARTADRS